MREKKVFQLESVIILVIIILTFLGIFNFGLDGKDYHVGEATKMNLVRNDISYSPDQTNFKMDSNLVNTPPQILSNDVHIKKPGSFSFTIKVLDDDKEPLDYFTNVNLDKMTENGMLSFDGVTYGRSGLIEFRFTFTPGTGSTGKYEFIFSASDSVYETSRRFTLTFPATIV
jgi:hypothetical protein